MDSFIPVYEKTTSVEGWLTPKECYFLYHIAREADRNGEIVEIGSWKGRSTVFMAYGSQNVKGPKVTAIDPHKGEWSTVSGITKNSPTLKDFRKNIGKTKLTNRVIAKVATSQAVAKKWHKKVSLIFIDGIHLYEYAKQDFELWAPFVTENGIIAFHDAFWGDRGVQKAIEEKVLFNPDYSGFGVAESIFFTRKKRAVTFSEKLQVWQYRILYPLGCKLFSIPMPKSIKFLIIHRLLNALMRNKYTIGFSKISEDLGK